MLVCFTLVFATAANASTENYSPDRSVFSFDLIRNPSVPRSYFWSPVFCFFLPGIDQWYEGQTTQAGLYTGVAILGSVTEVWAAETYRGLSGDDRITRRLLGEVGGQLSMASGSLSAYASFRSSVRTQQPQGRFLFLKQEEKVDELLGAPFDFSLMKRPSTFIPLLLIIAAETAHLFEHNEPFRNNDFTFRDFAFNAETSYVAGVHEEAFFRGFLMPVMMNSLGSEFWSNTTTALIFAAAHLNRTNLPVAQFIGGWYLGNLAQKNEWSLRQSIFVHAWYDVIVGTAEYLYDSKNDPARAVLKLPTFEYNF